MLRYQYELVQDLHEGGNRELLSGISLGRVGEGVGSGGESEGDKRRALQGDLSRGEVHQKGNGLDSTSFEGSIAGGTGLMAWEDDIGTRALTSEILPRLESAISDALIPAFFEECLNPDDGGSSRLLKGEGGNLRQRKLGQISGLDSKPRDFPLDQQGEFEP